MAKRGSNFFVGHFVIIAALFVGLLINISASIIYEMIKDSPLAVGATLFLTGLSFIVIIATYHNTLREPVGKLLSEFE
ncbi:MAG: hypothetical protein WBC38_02690 [Microgenomates group bacterium]|jgi:uncharacterized membrane protein YbhN (UPF0104 family)